MSIKYLENKWEETLFNLKKEDNYRDVFPFYRAENSHCLNFSSNDYLNLSADSRLAKSGYIAAIHSGVGNGASRSVLQCDTQIESLEKFFALNVDFKYSIFFASGFLANISFFDVISPYFKENIEQDIFVDHRVHASIFYGLKSLNYYTFRHHDYKQLEKKLSRSNAKAKIIVIESLYSMDGDFSQAAILQNLCEKYNSLLFVDESHSFGIYGPLGSGWLNQFPQLKKHVLCAIYGCGKSVGVSGGFFSTNSYSLYERVRQKSKVFIYSTGISPFITGSVYESLRIIFSQEGEYKRKLLHNNILYFKKISQNLCFGEFYFLLSEGISPIFSFIIKVNKIALNLENKLRKNNIIVKCIRTPSVPKNLPRLRLSLTCNHTQSDIQYALLTLHKYSTIIRQEVTLNDHA